jgi:hypothetical protein
VDGLAEGSRGGRRPAVSTARPKKADMALMGQEPGQGVEGQLAEAPARRGARPRGPLADGEAGEEVAVVEATASARASTVPAATRSSKATTSTRTAAGSALSSCRPAGGF